MNTISKLQYSDRIQNTQIVDNINEMINFMDAIAGTIHDEDGSHPVLKAWARQYKFKRRSP